MKNNEVINVMTCIEKLLQSDISGYRMHQDFPNIWQEQISLLRRNEVKISNLTLQSAYALCEAYHYYFN